MCRRSKHLCGQQSAYPAPTLAAVSSITQRNVAVMYQYLRIITYATPAAGVLMAISLQQRSTYVSSMANSSVVCVYHVQQWPAIIS